MSKPSIYLPAEDSFFLAEFLKKEISQDSNVKKIKFLDMGSGSGMLAENALDSGILPENITVADIDKSAIKALTKKFPKSKVILSDLFGKIKGKYDLIAFNPPYLPENKFDKKRDTSGGESGSRTINKFLEEAKMHLSNKGRILILTSSFTKKMNWKGYRKELLGKKRIFFEELYVWKLFLGIDIKS